MLKLAFYRGKGNWITYLIRLLTLGIYSHTELVFNENECFSASGRGAACVRWVHQDLTNGWDFILISVPPHEIEKVRAFANQFVGLPYNWTGMLKWLFPWLQPKPDHWYCTELLVMVLQECFGLLQGVPRQISPKRLYRLLEAEAKIHHGIRIVHVDQVYQSSGEDPEVLSLELSIDRPAV